MIPSGDGSTNNTPGLHHQVSFSGNDLVTTDGNFWFFTADEGWYPLTSYWKWSGHEFSLVRNNQFTAQATSAPSGGQVWPATCRAMPANGTYFGDIQAAPASHSVDAGIAITVSTPDSYNPSCQLRVGPYVPMTVKATTTAGAAAWITAPAWMLLNELDLPFGGSLPGVPLTITGTRRGSYPYYVPPSLGVSTTVSNLGVPVEATLQMAGDYPEATLGNVTVQNGTVMAIGITD
jgi:hypothetical protein